ncbi:PREDICTED: pentatricopeptide repeat-containing protein At2g27610-like [Ipomoea nil]|uniref:pentatricopeptide repeat-containing protein At2g27610-like n=1 Tax=Ipomoea nil TaxID=35883 RepID=UPI000901BC67|nr:PREDICTED: pentatricopeptide repeat-containing protein At2g27610-like [Ipomoea nil]
MSLSQIIRSCTTNKSILSGKAAHAQLIKYGSKSDVYTNNHLLSMYVTFHEIECAQKLFDEMPKRNVITWTTLISSYSHMGLSEKALGSFRSMVLEDGFTPNHYTYVGALSACSCLGAARTGKEIHGRIFRAEETLNNFVSNCLVNFYGKCGLLKSAQLVFDAMLEPNTVTWASLLSCHCQCGEYDEGLRIFLRSLRAGVLVNEFLCGIALGACASVECLGFGMGIHCLIVKCGVKMDQYVVTGLVNFYVKCGQLGLAYNTFNMASAPELHAWTALIGGCVQQGKGREAVNLFCKLLSSGLKPSERTYASVLGAFTDTKEFQVGMQLHSFIIKLGFNSFTFVCNALVDFYSKSNLLDESFKIFQEMTEYDIVTWNALIAGYIRSGHYEQAIKLLQEMLFEGLEPNLHTYSCILSICGDLPAIEWGKQVHCRIMKPGFDSNVVVGSTLIDMYAKCGRLGDARKVFDILPCKNLVSWNTMLIGYAQHGFGKEALEIYSMMQENGVKPNDITFVGVLSACGHGGLLEEGLNHFNSMKNNYGITPRTNHLACMVNLFARKGQTKKAYDFIRSFPEKPDKVVWRCLLSGCNINKDFVLGKYAAEEILSIDPNDTSAHVTLSNIYARLNMWDEAAQIRKMMKQKELKKETGCSWTELQNKIYCFSSSYNMLLGEVSMKKLLIGLTAQLLDAGYVPDTKLSFDYGD